MSQSAWPWHRWGLFAAILAAGAFLVVGGIAGWLLADGSSPFSPPGPTKTFPDQTVNVTIPGSVLNPGSGQTPDNADKVPPDPPGVVSAVIPGAAFEKLAPVRELWVHQPPPSKVSTWGPTIATLIVGALAVFGVIITWWQKNEADKRSEWWRRTAWAFERTFSVDKTTQPEAAQPETAQADTAQPETAPAEAAVAAGTGTAQAQAQAAVADATVGWKVLETLMGSKLATGEDSKIVQVIGEHVALVAIERQEGSDGNSNPKTA